MKTTLAKKYTPAIAALTRGDLVVMPTDTVWGILAIAKNKKAVARLYRARGRSLRKPCIILISHSRDMQQFDVQLTTRQKMIIKKVWPGPISVICAVRKKKWEYLHRGTQTLAFRVPKSASLRFLLEHTGPLIAPSANPEGYTTARTRREARVYFGSKVAVYLGGKSKPAQPSGIIDLRSHVPVVVREHPMLIAHFYKYPKARTIAPWTKIFRRAHSAFTKN